MSPLSVPKIMNYFCGSSHRFFPDRCLRGDPTEELHFTGFSTHWCQLILKVENPINALCSCEGNTSQRCLTLSSLFQTIARKKKRFDASAHYFCTSARVWVWVWVYVSISCKMSTIMRSFRGPGRLQREIGSPYCSHVSLEVCPGPGVGVTVCHLWVSFQVMQPLQLSCRATACS